MSHFIITWFILVPSMNGGPPLQYENGKQVSPQYSIEACYSYAKKEAEKMEAKEKKKIYFSCVEAPK